MGQLSSFSPLMKIIAGVFIVSAIITVISGAMFVFYYFYSAPQGGNNVAFYRIVLHLTEELQRLNLSFGVLHVRDGKDEVPGHGPLLNEEIQFKAIDRHGTIAAKVTYQKRLGFQFKCFVDPGPHEYGKIEQLLKAANFSDISEGGGKKFRIWFILDDYTKYTTIDGILNNFYYPS